MRNSNDETISEQAQHWVVRLASGSMTAVELAAFKTWLGRSDAHQRAFADERRFWHRLSPLGETFERLDREPVSSAAATAASASPVRRGYRVVRTGRMRWRHSAIAGLALAACLLLFMAGPPLLTRLEADHVSGFDRTVSTTLSDGSRVTLNRGSAIRVDIGDAVRRVELLRGEVFVEVKPDVTHPFRVTDALERWAYPPERLTLEITENALMVKPMPPDMFEAWLKANGTPTLNRSQDTAKQAG